MCVNIFGKLILFLILNREEKKSKTVLNIHSKNITLDTGLPKREKKTVQFAFCLR